MIMEKNMKKECFKLSNIKEIGIFEDLMKRTVAYMPNHISLVKAYKALQDQADGGRIFTALLDIFLSFAFLHAVLSVVEGIKHPK